MARNGQLVRTFGAHLRGLLKERGLSNRAFAELMGRHETQVSRWTTMEHPPNVPTLIRMADIFEVSLDEMVGRDFRGRGSAGQGATRGPGPDHPADSLDGRSDQGRARRRRGTRGSG